VGSKEFTNDGGNMPGLDKILKLRGYKKIKQFPALEPIVSMMEFAGKIYIATSKRIYRLEEDDSFFPLKIYTEKED
jgi:hypothetical protein